MCFERVTTRAICGCKSFGRCSNGDDTLGLWFHSLCLRDANPSLPMFLHYERQNADEKYGRTTKLHHPAKR